MNYTCTFQNTPIICGYILFPISHRAINAEMYEYNSLHPLPTRTRPFSLLFAHHYPHILLPIDIIDEDANNELSIYR